MSALETRHVSVTHGFPLAWSAIFVSMMPRWILLAATLPLALRLATRLSVGGGRPVRLAGGTPAPQFRAIAIHIALFLAISLAHATVIAWTLAFVNPGSYFFSWPARLMRAWYSAMPVMVSMYGAVLAAAWALHEARERELRSVRASQLEAQLQAAQLSVLRARLQPHFLYNTLNGIAALVVDARSKEAVAAIEQLSDLLHASLRDDGRNVVSVRDEVGLAERYLALQQMRFGDRLHHEVVLAPEVADCVVPVLLLQPLVENAVVHGLEADQSRLRVAIAATAVNGRIELRVENDGAGLDESTRADGHGVGLAATRARLATAYGDLASLELLPRPGGGVVVRVILPRSELA